MTAATDTIRGLLDSGAGLAKFGEFVEAQGGDRRIVQETHLLRQASRKMELRAAHEGYIVRMDSAEIGRAAILLGAGRAKKGDSIDLAAGIKLHRRCGEFIAAGDVLATLFFNEKIEPARAGLLIEKSIHIGKKKIPAGALIAGTVASSGWHEGSER